MGNPQMSDYKIMIDMQLSKTLIYCCVLILLTGFGHTLTSSSSTLSISFYNYPSAICSAYCMYEINSIYNYVSQCTLNYNISGYILGNGYCTKCDPLLFRQVLNTGTGTTYYCIPHLYNSESVVYGQNRDVSLGYYLDHSATTWINSNVVVVTSLPPHFALRVRFGVYLYNFQISQYVYPLEYTIDSTAYTYNQTLDKYWSPYDIITSPLTNHTDSQTTITFRLTDNTKPINTDPYCETNLITGNCLCYFTYCMAGSCSTCGLIGCWSITTCAVFHPQTQLCCDYRYIKITDMIVFASLCQTGCLKCSSSTYCIICDTSNIADPYYLYPKDHMCYKTCPQATYKDNSTLFLNAAVYGVSTIEYWCSDCNITCLECSSPTSCSKCYYAGKNESFLYNNTCVNPCYNGYQGNYTTHTCVCPQDYYYEIVASLLCNPCAVECVRCFGPSNLECTYCEKGYYLANQTTHCLLECPDGQYKNDLTRTCYNCDASCSSCKTESTYCTKCFFSNPVKYLLGSQCLTWCPAGYSWNNITYRCQQCDFYTYSYRGACVQICPSMYQANSQNKSCIHLSKTAYRFDLKIISVSILSHGKLLKIEVLAQDGLNYTSYSAIMKRSYFNAQVIYKDSMLEAFNGIRSLVNSNLPIRNVQYQNNKIYYYVDLPSTLDYRKSFQINLLQSIAGNQNIYYNNATNVYPVNQHPQLMKSYFLFSAKNNYHLILLPLIIIVLFLFSLQLKGVYDLYMEFFRVIQLLGLLVYSAFPVGSYIFYFLIGCSYANLDFIPNLYAMAAKPQTIKNFVSYSLTAEDMDFIRLNGSVLFFAIIWTCVVIIAKYLFHVKYNRLRYMIAFGIDLMQVKILHSFWSSLLFIIINYTITNFSVFVTFAFAFVLFSVIIARRYVIWKDQKDVSPFFVWRLLSTLLICFISLSNELLITLIFCISIGVTIWEFYLLHSSKYLINISNLNSTNYMNEKTFKVLNNYDEEVQYCSSILVRNIIITMLPIATALLASILILLKESQQEAVIFTSVVLYFFLIIIIIDACFIYKFLEARRKYLVQNKLEFLQKKYAKLSNNETIVYQERKRPRVANQPTVFDEEKYFQQHPARSMMKNID